MRTKSVAGVVALVACGALALTGSAGAGGNAETTVTIQAGGEIFGYVKSPKPNRCADGRKVTVFKQKGGAQGGGDDIKVGTDNAGEPIGDRSQWSIGNPGVTGKVYARAGKIPGCQADNSRTVTVG